MENYKLEQSKESLPTSEELMDDFYKKFSESGEKDVKIISLEQLKELKEKNITTEGFLNYICEKKRMLLHGSINEITNGTLKSNEGKIFATDKSAVAIMKSLYSNIGVNLEYPYHFNENNPLVLKIHTPPDGKFISKDKGFVYVVSEEDFENKPEGSWQFVKEVDETDFDLSIETEKNDFKYPVEFYDDLNKR